MNRVLTVSYKQKACFSWNEGHWMNNVVFKGARSFCLNFANYEL